MAVCAFCRSTLLKRGTDVERIGELATVLDDASPIQIGTAGRYGKRAFTVLGRIQMTYDAGAWSEWYVVFDDGTFGWLSDASGQYAITVREPTMRPAAHGLRSARWSRACGSTMAAARFSCRTCAPRAARRRRRTAVSRRCRLGGTRRRLAHRQRLRDLRLFRRRCERRGRLYGRSPRFDALAFTGLRDTDHDTRESAARRWCRSRARAAARRCRMRRTSPTTWCAAVAMRACSARPSSRPCSRRSASSKR